MGAGKSTVARTFVERGAYLIDADNFYLFLTAHGLDMLVVWIIFFEMLAGRRPVGGDEPHQIAAQYLAGSSAKLADLAPHVPAELAAIVGSASLPRTQVVSKIWEYIKKNKLQDAVNKRMINADAKLKEVFGKVQVSMFEMAGLIGKHVK